MSNVSLTSAMNSNLLALKQTSSLMAMTQNRLATGLKVNSAIDNPSAYYTAVSLNNRAADLNSLLDNMGQAIQTVKAAVEGVETATKFLEQMQSITEQAIAEPVDLGPFYGYIKITKDWLSMSMDDIQALMTDGAKFVLMEDIELNSSVFITANNVTIEGNGHKLSYIDNTTEQSFMLGISGSDVKINNIIFDLQDNSDYWTAVIGVDSAENLKLTNFKINATGKGPTGVVAVSSTVKMSNFEINTTGDGSVGVYAMNSTMEMTNFEITATEIGIAYGYNAQVKLDSDTGINVSGANSDKFNGDEDSEVIIDSSLSATWSEDEANSKVPEKIGVAEEWSKAFNGVLNQYDMLIDDASYKGINLLKGEQLNVAFNEDKSSKLNILGKDIHSSALGLSSAAWETVDDVNKAVADLQRCVATLRSLSGELGNHYSVVQSRQDFTESLINILTEGADKLTLADMNEESAIMLALQTRQQLAINSLSLASQSAQSVLRLFA